MANTAPRRRVRPRLLTERLVVAVPPGTLDRLDAAARARGENMSQSVRGLLMDWLATAPTEPPEPLLGGRPLPEDGDGEQPREGGEA